MLLVVNPIKSTLKGRSVKIMLLTPTEAAWDPSQCISYFYLAKSKRQMQCNGSSFVPVSVSVQSYAYLLGSKSSCTHLALFLSKYEQNWFTHPVYLG